MLQYTQPGEQTLGPYHAAPAATPCGVARPDAACLIHPELNPCQSRGASFSTSPRPVGREALLLFGNANVASAALTSFCIILLGCSGAIGTFSEWKPWVDEHQSHTQ
jgi:hypothetical protein